MKHDALILIAVFVYLITAVAIGMMLGKCICARIF
jgi:hypothetical protein